MSTRAELRADLADAVRELTEPRHHVEYLERSVTEVIDDGRRRKGKRTRQRRRHAVTLPSLLQALLEAMTPASSADSIGGSGFESRPSAELEPISVLRMITEQTGVWCRLLSVDRATLVAALHGLVGSEATDEQLAHLAHDAERWVKRARLATGFDKAPLTLNQPCPYCGRRHAIVVTGDLTAGRCSRCGTEWTPDTIGLLADMLTANTTQVTMALPRCVWAPDCHRMGPHDEHADGSGRTWRDTCDVPWAVGS